MSEVSLSRFLAGVAAGELASFPTDTVPALAALPAVAAAIYAAKQRPADKPLILMAATLADLRPYLVLDDALLAQVEPLTQRHWPGALTLVLPASDRLPAAMNPQATGTVGVRVPAHPLARHLLAQTGPLATTSINRSGQPPLLTLNAIRQQFPTVLTLADGERATIDGGHPLDQAEGSGQPSTVVTWTETGWHVLRQGAVSVADLA